MTKTNAVAMNDMELDMVSGGGVFDAFGVLKDLREKLKFGKDESPAVMAVKTGVLVGLMMLLANKFFSKS